MAAPTPPPAPEEPRRTVPLMGRLEKFTTAVLLALVVWLVSTWIGCPIISQTEEGGIDGARPHADYRGDIPPDVLARAGATEAEVDATLRAIAQQFGNEREYLSTVERNRLGLTEDEQEYYNQIKRRTAPDGGGTESPAEWYNKLTSAYRTYQRVRGIVADVSGRDAQQVDARVVDQVLNNSGRAQEFYEQLSLRFGVAPEAAEAFGKDRPTDLSDWATWLQGL